MGTPLARILCTLALAAGLTATAVSPAAAESLTLSDKRGDVLLLPAGAMSDDELRPAPAMSHGDIARSVVRHGDKRVSVRVKLAELRKTRGYRVQVIRVVTNEGVRRDIAVASYPGAVRGEASIGRPNGREARCDGLAHRVDYERDVVKISFPRSCVSNPRWVRIGVGSIWAKDSGDMYIDEALRAGSVSDTGLRLSPRVSRG